MSIVKIANRNVSRQKRRSNLLVGAIAFGVVIIVLVNSLTAGIINNTRNNFTSLLGGHIYISGQEILDSGRVVNRTADTEILDNILPEFDLSITGVIKRSAASGEFIFGSKSTMGSFTGVHWEAESSLLDSLILQSGSFENISSPDSIILPDKAAQKLGVQIGETVLFRFDTVTGQKNVAEFTIAAIIKDTGSFGISSSYGNISWFNPLLGLEADEYQNLNLYLDDMKMMIPLSQELEDKIGAVAPLANEADSEGQGNRRRMMGFSGSVNSVEEWEGTRFKISTLNDYMDTIMELVNILNGVATGLFIVLLTITMVGLINTFRMILIERTREIGTMRAMGMLKADIKKLFLLEALFLALKGAVVGIIIAILIGFGITLIPFGNDSFMGFFLNSGSLSMPAIPIQMFGVILLLSIITLLSAWLPARKAAELLPADALRSNA